MRRRWTVALLGAVVLAVAVGLTRQSSSAEVRTGAGAAQGATVVRYRLRSRFVHASLPQTAVRPAGAAGRPPLLVFLHGRGGNGNEANANGAFYAALARLGTRAPAVVFPNGGDHSYWHARRDGDWARYVLDEVIPAAVRRLHADPRRVAIGGISMGGFGAFDIARLRPARFCAVGGHSAALWLRAADTAPGAFDDARDFAAHDLIGLARAHGRGPWRGIRLWLDGGDGDPFRSPGQAFARALGLTMHRWPGGHTASYWQAHYPRYLRFYADALASCRR